jgi:hypothetical protein
MRYHWMLVTMGVAAISGLVLVTKIAHPCSGDLTGTAPTVEHRADLEREALSARAAAALADAISLCGTDAGCVTRTTERFARFEADALGATARDQRDALIDACKQKL